MLSVMSNSMRPHGLQPPRLLCPWDSPGKNTGVGCHALLRGIFLTQGSNLNLPHCRWFFTAEPLVSLWMNHFALQHKLTHIVNQLYFNKIKKKRESPSFACFCRVGPWPEWFFRCRMIMDSMMCAPSSLQGLLHNSGGGWIGRMFCYATQLPY